MSELREKNRVLVELVTIRGEDLEEVFKERDAFKQKAGKWDEFRASFRNHECNYGIICAEKIDVESKHDILKEQLKKTEFPNGLWVTNVTWDAINKRAESAEAEVARLKNLIMKYNNEVVEYEDKMEARLAEAEKSGKLFCEEQCEEGPGWGECEESGCHLFSIKKALRGDASPKARNGSINGGEAQP